MLLEMITGRGEMNVWSLGLFHSGSEVIWSLRAPADYSRPLAITS